MTNKAFILILSFVSIIQLSYGQEYDYELEDTTKSKFFIGVNIGAFFANDQTAVFYSGSPSITQYGVEYILFDRQDLQQTFSDYFVHPYTLDEYPFEPRYKTTMQLGLHLGYQLTNDIAIYADLNSVQLKYEQSLTIAISDPQNVNKLDPKTYEELPLYAKESRFNFNLGTQISYYSFESTRAYVNVFGNFNGVQLNENYFVVNNVEYQIQHPIDNDFNQKPGGIAYGGGAGLGLKFEVAENILADIYYNLYYQQINLSENLKPHVYNHAIGLRILWN